MADQGEILAGRFTVLQSLQRESITATLLAQDTDGRKVLLRELRMASLDNWSTVQKFEKRATQYQELQSGSLPECVGFFSDETRDDAAFYFAFEFVEGTDLEHVLEAEGPQSDEKVRAMLRDMLGGLALLHHSDPLIVHGGIRPATIVRIDEGGYRFAELPLPDLPAVPATSPGKSIIDEAYRPLEQRKGQTKSESDLFSLGMTAVYMITGKHPHLLPTRHFKPVFRPRETGSALDLAIDTMIDPGTALKPKSAMALIRILDGESDPVVANISSELESAGGAAIEIRSTSTGDAVHVTNPSASRPESLLVGFFLDLWVSKPWLIIIIVAALSAGPALIPLLIFLFHPKSRSLINRAFARFRDVTVSLRGGSLSVSDQIKSLDYADLDGYHIRENRTGAGIQLEVVLDTRDGKQHRFYMNGLGRGDARRIKNLLEKRINPAG